MNNFKCIILLIVQVGFARAQTVVDTLVLIDKAKEIVLPEKLKEVSGLEYIDGYIWAFNDSGGEAVLYKLDIDTGEIVGEVEIENAKNVDWEDITSDKNFIYIGDIGNNSGNRENLRIYKVSKKDILDKKKQEVSAQIIKFYYPEQRDYSKQKNNKTNFDAEALVAHQGKLYLYTKEWSSYCTTQYELDPSHYKKQAAKMVQVFDAESAITGADSKGEEIILTGYTKEGLVIGWVINKFERREDKSEYRKIIYGIGPKVGQIEGITYGDGDIYISSEDFKKQGFHVNQKIYILKEKQLLGRE